MTVTINGTTGLAGTNGSARTPAVQGEDTNTGIFFPAADTVAVATGGAERVRVDNSGFASIGSTTAPAKLTVVRELAATPPALGSSTGAAFFMGGASNAYGLIGGVAGAGYSWLQSQRVDATATAYDLLVQPSGGSLVVGTTSPAQTISTNNVLTLKGKDPANVWGVGPTSSFGNFYISTGGTGVSLAGGATSWGTVSDERQKDIIEPIADAVAKVLSLRSVIGKYKTDADGTRRSFLIAQDVQAVLPEAVDVGEDEANTLAVKYTEVIPLLVAAIKEQQATITALTARVAQLEAQ